MIKIIVKVAALVGAGVLADELVRFGKKKYLAYKAKKEETVEDPAPAAPEAPVEQPAAPGAAPEEGATKEE